MAVGMIAASMYNDTPEQARQRILASAAVGVVAGAAIGVAPVFAPGAGTVLAAAFGGGLALTPATAAVGTALASGGVAAGAADLTYNLTHSGNKFNSNELYQNAAIEGATGTLGTVGGPIANIGLNTVASVAEYHLGTPESDRKVSGYVGAGILGLVEGTVGSIANSKAIGTGTFLQTTIRDGVDNTILTNATEKAVCAVGFCPQ
jgi:hypothetical protein